MEKIDAMCAAQEWTQWFGKHVKQFLRDRREDFVRDAQTGLTKADMDTRDLKYAV